MTVSSPGKALAAWLQEQATAVRALEKEAATALYDKKDEAAYREQMSQKAGLLASLASDSADLVAALPEKEREAAASELSSFSYNAATALRLNSVFYMAALLYPDDHKDGEPNNLERFISRITK